MALGIKINPNAFKAGIAKARESSTIMLDPGTYTCVCKKLRSANDKLVLDLRVLDAEVQGVISIFYTLEPDRIGYLIRDMEKLGFIFSEEDGDNASAVIDAIAEEISKGTIVLRVRAKANGEFINYQIQKRLEDLVESEEVQSSEEQKPAPTPTKPAPTAKAAPTPTQKPSEPAPKALPAKPAAPTPKPAAPAPVKADTAKYGELATMDRTTLKALLVAENIGFTVTRACTDDQIRDAILAARAAGQVVEDTPEEDPTPSVEPESEVEAQAESEPEAEVQAEEPVADEEAVVEEEPVAEEEELKIGMKVKAILGGKVTDCTVHKIDEANNRVTVRNTGTGSLHSVTPEKLSM